MLILYDVIYYFSFKNFNLNLKIKIKHVGIKLLLKISFTRLKLGCFSRHIFYFYIEVDTVVELLNVNIIKKYKKH